MIGEGASPASEVSPIELGWENRSFLARARGDARVFGDTDGSRASLSGFIDPSELRASAFFSPDPYRVRVVVGRKGSGKTLFLRKLRDEVEHNPGVLLRGPMRAQVREAEQTQLISTEQVIRVAQWFPESYLTEVWQLCWGRAIISAAATHLLFDKGLRPYVSDEVREELGQFRSLIGNVKAARSPFTTLRGLIERARSGQSLLRRLNDPLWDDLETVLGEALRDAPPLYFVIDAIDEDFAYAPAYWLRCQKGLFYEAMRLLRNSRLGGRLHVLISIRDLVFFSVFQSEHASRYIGDSHVFVLDWGMDAARAFLDAKLRRLSSEFSNRGQPGQLSDWLGFSHVTNSRGEVEEVSTYLLRHTQCLPRDVVVFGNLMGAALADTAKKDTVLSEEMFKSVVSDVARVSGLQQIRVVANQVIADEIPAGAVDQGYAASYLAVDEYKTSRGEEVIDIIRKARFLRIDANALVELQVAGQRIFDAPDLGTILWQAGLLGVEHEGESLVTFFSMDKLGRMRLPRDVAGYVFHPSMREVADLEPRGATIRWSM